MLPHTRYKPAFGQRIREAITEGRGSSEVTVLNTSGETTRTIPTWTKPIVTATAAKDHIGARNGKVPDEESGSGEPGTGDASGQEDSRQGPHSDVKQSPHEYPPRDRRHQSDTDESDGDPSKSFVRG